MCIRDRELLVRSVEYVPKSRDGLVRGEVRGLIEAERVPLRLDRLFDTVLCGSGDMTFLCGR